MFAGPLLNVLVTVEEVGTVQVTVPNQGGSFPWDWPDKVALQFPQDALRIVSETGTATEELDPEYEEDQSFDGRREAAPDLPSSLRNSSGESTSNSQGRLSR